MSQTLTDLLEVYFRQHPNEDIDSWQVLRIAGHGGFRARISDCRDRGMTIENKKVRTKCGDGITRTFSTYRYIPPAQSLLEICERAEGQAGKLAP